MRDRVRPEILAPAGDEERLEAALLYGADAVYLAGQRFGMRSAPANFDREGLRRAVERCHGRGVKTYVTCNILPRSRQLDELPAYLSELDAVGVDALIVADLGVLSLMKRYAPHCALHVSTQLGVVNYETARVLYEMGASRVVLARELSLEEIREIREKTPPELELEAFVHGAMCMAYSGRCLLSRYLTGRDANLGDCTQPCRWKYEVMEPGRPGRPLTVEPDEEGTYLFNANDLCMVDYMAQLSEAGIDSMKIEGRAKAAYYVAAATGAYKAAALEYEKSGFSATYRPSPWIREELDKISHRPYGTGFYFGEPSQDTKQGGYLRPYQVAAVVTGWEDGWLIVSQRNRFLAGEALEALEPLRPPFFLDTTGMTDQEGNLIEAAPHPTMEVRFRFDRPLVPGTFLRRKNG